MKKPLIIEVPILPPSVNSCYLYLNGARLPKLSYKKFTEQFGVLVAKIINTAYKGLKLPYKGKLEMEINFYFPNKRKQDIDNRIKPLLDTITKCGIWEDDDQVYKLIAEKYYDKNKPATVISIKEID